MIDLAGIWFEGPFSSTDQIRNQSGVYVVASAPHGLGLRTWLDVGESGELRDRLDNHDRRGCWFNNSPQGWVYFIHYCNEAERMRVEQELRRRLNPTCGER